MPSRNRAFSAACLLALSAGTLSCAPVYRDFSAYTEPANETGRQCVRDAASARDDCLTAARAARQRCLDEEESRARSELASAEFQFHIDSSNYDRCVARVDREEGYRLAQEARQKVWEAQREERDYQDCLARGGYCTRPLPDYGGGQWEYEQALERLKRSRCGEEPEKPELSDFEYYGACPAAQGACPAAYDRDYRACGGQVVVERRCVEHCD